MEDIYYRLTPDPWSVEIRQALTRKAEKVGFNYPKQDADQND